MAPDHTPEHDGTRDSATALTARVTARLARLGFAVVRPFPVSAFNDAAAPEDRLPDFGRGNALALLVGSARDHWGVFRAALRADPALRSEPSPVDAYTERSMREAVSPEAPAHELRYAHTLAPRPIPAQRIAVASGAAFFSPVALCVHPAHGLWFAIRAVLVLDLSMPDGGSAPAEAESPCATCSTRPCEVARAEVLRRLERGPEALRPEERRSPVLAWLPVRDACVLTPGTRYEPDAIGYHYTKDRRFLD